MCVCVCVCVCVRVCVVQRQRDSALACRSPHTEGQEEGGEQTLPPSITSWCTLLSMSATSKVSNGEYPVLRTASFLRACVVSAVIDQPACSSQIALSLNKIAPQDERVTHRGYTGDNTGEVFTYPASTCCTDTVTSPPASCAGWVACTHERECWITMCCCNSARISVHDQAYAPTHQFDTRGTIRAVQYCQTKAASVKSRGSFNIPDEKHDRAQP